MSNRVTYGVGGLTPYGLGRYGAEDGCGLKVCINPNKSTHFHLGLTYRSVGCGYNDGGKAERQVSAPVGTSAQVRLWDTGRQAVGIATATIPILPGTSRYRWCHLITYACVATHYCRRRLNQLSNARPGTVGGVWPKRWQHLNDDGVERNTCILVICAAQP